MKINIGAGDTVHSDYVRLDIDPATNPDHTLDLEKDRFPFEDSTVETVLAHHVLEHLGPGFFHCMQEIYRVCQSGAVVDIVVPHPRHEAFLADPTHRRPITVMTLQLFSKKFNQVCRTNQWPSSRLGELYDVDFEILDFDYRFDETAKNSLSSLSVQQLQEYANHHNNIISEIRIRLIAVKNAHPTIDTITQ